MTLGEAIKHAEEVADYDCYNEKQFKCTEEHRQLAEWLKDYKRLKEQKPILDKIKAEIEQVSFTHYFEYGEYYGEDSRQERIVNFDTVIQIIDKYKTESEK